MSQVRSQHWSEFKSDRRTRLSCKLEIVTYTVMSSANNLTWDGIFSGRSLMYNRKRSGPSTAPWGTPEVTGTSFENSPSNTTEFECDLLEMAESSLVRFLLHQSKQVYKEVLDDLLYRRLC